MTSTRDRSAAWPHPHAIPSAAWSRPIGLPHENPGHPRVDYKMVDDGPFNGAPVGGMGAGSIGRTYRGDFARWHLDVGFHHYKPLPACMFSVYEERDGQKVTQALWTEKPEKSLSSWNWNYPVGAGTYHALYPRSWFTYDGARFQSRLSVEQFSPVIPHNYRESSYPVALYVWSAHNPTDQPITLGIMFTWQDVLGYDFKTGKAAAGCVHQSHSVHSDIGTICGGVTRRTTNLSGESLAIAVLETPGVSISYRARFQAEGDGADIWNDFAADGALDNVDDSTPSESGEALGTGVAATITLQPGQIAEIPFVLAWDMPVMSFSARAHWYKRYTAFYGRNGDNAWQIACDGLAQRDSWREQIIAWQSPILNDPIRPDWYKTALFNELYFLADGGTAWEHGRVGETVPDADYLGRCMYIECFDYVHYATLDVDFYASFALLELFPELEKRLINDYADAVRQEDLRDHRIAASGEIVPRMKRGSVPHDLGGPNENPWLELNNYTFQDVNRWKDLNAKFVLRLYRDAVLLNDRAMITAYWDAAQEAMEYLKAMDHDGDGIPENEGIPDQTYDTWPVTGVSAYSASLWLAALAASREMAKSVGDNAVATRYDAQLEAATAVFEAKLWNGSYYNYDASDSPYHDSVMSDQLCGQWYADYFNISLLPISHVESALKTVYRLNVMGYGDGEMGTVNGMRPDGRIDTSDIQSEEMWTGTAYGLAAFMLLRGLDEEAWATAYGVYKVTYETSGLWFRTPEAFDVNGNYRASLYQRPLTIWAIETSLRLRAACKG